MDNSIKGQDLNPNYHFPIYHEHDQGSCCWGYATARAFGKSWENPLCSAKTINNINAIATTHFDRTTPFSYQNVTVGDIIEFNSHVAYVSSKTSSTASGIKLDFVENCGADVEKKGIPLNNVINGEDYCVFNGEVLVCISITNRGNPIGYFSRKNTWKANFSNSFGSGDIKANGTTGSSPLTLTNLKWGRVSVDAIENGELHDFAIQRFQYWKDDETQQTLNTTQQAQLDVVHSIYYTKPFTAVFFREYEIRFENMFVGLSNSGSMNINGNIYSLPSASPFPVYDGNGIQATALNQTISGIYYQFDRWHTGELTTSATFYPTETPTTYIAQFIGKPAMVQGISDMGAVGQPIQLGWNQHTNANVRYRIYRKVKNVSPTTLIADLPNATTTFTDQDYIKTSSYTNFLLSYDVRGYYTVEETEATSNWLSFYGDIAFKRPGYTDSTSQIPSKEQLFLSNFPNPFNPTTNLFFHLPATGRLRIDIFDLNGRHIKSLTDTDWEAGNHSLVWEGVSENGETVPSGIYFARLIHPKGVMTTKLLLTR